MFPNFSGLDGHRLVDHPRAMADWVGFDNKGHGKVGLVAQFHEASPSYTICRKECREAFFRLMFSLYSDGDIPCHLANDTAKYWDEEKPL